MKIFIASHSPALALQAKAALVVAGHTVTSTWHDAEFKRTAESTEDERCEGATRNIAQVTEADGVLLITPEQSMPGGLYVEVGAAIGQGKPVFAVGLRPNGTRGNYNLYIKLVSQHDSICDAVRAIPV